MSTTDKTYDEKLQEARLKAERAANRVKKMEQQHKAEERKARTKRLIAIGAEVEHYAKCEILNLESFKAYLSQYAAAIAKTQTVPVQNDEKNTTDMEEASSQVEEIRIQKEPVQNVTPATAPSVDTKTATAQTAQPNPLAVSEKKVSGIEYDPKIQNT